MFRSTQNLVLEIGHQICDRCEAEIIKGDRKIGNVCQYNWRRGHSISQAYHRWYEKKLIQEAAYWREAYHSKDRELQKLLKVHKSARGYKKSCHHQTRNYEFYKRAKNYKDRDNDLYKIYEDEVEIEEKTHRFWNRIIYKDMTNKDTKCWTGFTKLQLIQQAKEVNLPPEDVFLMRVRIYRYYTFAEMEMMFGYSQTSLRINFVKTLNIMYEKYAKPRLLNSSMTEPGITRNIINDKHTPEFVKLVRGLDDTDRSGAERTIVVNQDSTYQYCQHIRTNHDLFKAMKSAHKKVPLLKIHIWSCTDGRPIWAVVCYSDWDHADGDIFASCFNKQHLEACYEDLNAHPDSTREETLKRHAKLDLSFHDLQTCKQMELLQQLMHDPADNLISDNGYKTRDGRLRMPLEPPQSDDGRLTVAAASWRRSITLVRQTCERMHRWCKRNRFCDTTINAADIKYVNKVWNIVMADIKFLDVKLMKDTNSTSKFVQLLLALRYVMTSPVEKFYIPSNSLKKLNAVKRAKFVAHKQKLAQQKKEQYARMQEQAAERIINQQSQVSQGIIIESEVSEGIIVESDESELFHGNGPPPPIENTQPVSDTNETEENKDETRVSKTEENEFISLEHITQYDDTFTTVAQGFDQIIHYLKCIFSNTVRKEIFGHYEITQKDVQQYIGKKYANKLSREYIAKMDTEYSDFTLHKCNTNDYVYLFRNLTSRYKVSNSYDIIISFAEIAYYNKALMLREIDTILDTKKQKDSISALKTYAIKYGVYSQQLFDSPVPQSQQLLQQSLSDYYSDVLKQKLGLKLNEHQNHWYQWLCHGGKKSQSTKVKKPKKRQIIHNDKEEMDDSDDSDLSHESDSDSDSDDHKNEEHLVSKYLSQHNKDILAQLTKRRMLSLNSKQDYRWGGYIIGKMRQARLKVFALDHGIKYKSIAKLKVADLKQYIYDHLMQTDPLATAEYEKHKGGDQSYDQQTQNEIQALQQRATDDDHNQHHLSYIDYNNHNRNHNQNHLPAHATEAAVVASLSINDRHQDLSKFTKVSQFEDFAKKHKIFDGDLTGDRTVFKYVQWKFADFKKFVNTYKAVWCKIANLDTAYTTTRKKSKLFKDIVKQWQLQWNQDCDAVNPESQGIPQEEKKESEGIEEKEQKESEGIEDDDHDDSEEGCDIILDKFDMERFWYDIDFDLWYSPLARLGVTCSCRSGAQLPSCCAHSSAILWLIWFSCFGNIANAFAISDRDRRILDTTDSGIYNFVRFKEWIRKDILLYGGIARFCHCKNAEPKSEIEKFCEGCQYYFHPSCCGVNVQQKDQKDKKDKKHANVLFHCKSCKIYQVYTFRYAQPASIVKSKKKSKKKQRVHKSRYF